MLVDLTMKQKLTKYVKSLVEYVLSDDFRGASGEYLTFGGREIEC